MLLQTSNLPKDYKVIAELNYVLYEKQRLFIVGSANSVVFIIKTPSPYPNHEDEPGLLVYQKEFPRSAAAWPQRCLKRWRQQTGASSRHRTVAKLL
mgnify:CR=1 FL=1